MEDCPSPSAGPFQTLNEGVAAERSCAIFRCEILSSIFLQSVDRVVRGTPTTTYVVSSARVTENCSVCRRHGKGRQVRYITCRKQGRETLASALTTYLHTLLPRNRTLHTRPTRLLRRQSRLDGGPARLPAKQSSTNPIQIKCILRRVCTRRAPRALAITRRATMSAGRDGYGKGKSESSSSKGLQHSCRAYSLQPRPNESQLAMPCT